MTDPIKERQKQYNQGFGEIYPTPSPAPVNQATQIAVAESKPSTEIQFSEKERLSYLETLEESEKGYVPLSERKDLAQAIREMPDEFFERIGIRKTLLMTEVIRNDVYRVRINNSLDVWNAQQDKIYPFAFFDADPDNQSLETIVKRRNDLIKAGESVTNYDKRYGFHVLNLPKKNGIAREVPFDLILELKDKYDNTYFSEEKNVGDLLNLYAEMAESITTIESDQGKPSNISENFMFSFENAFKKWKTFTDKNSKFAVYDETLQIPQSTFDEDKWSVLNTADDRMTSAPNQMTKFENFSVMLQESVRAGLVPPEIENLLDKVIVDGMIDIEGVIKIDTQEASEILNKLGIEPREGASYTTLGSFENPVKQLDSVLDNWIVKFYKSSNNLYPTSSKALDLNIYYQNQATKIDAENIFPVVGGDEIQDQIEINLFEEYSWNPSLDIGTNLKNIMNQKFVPGENGKLYSLNPNDSWPPSIVQLFGTKTVSSAARKVQNETITAVLNSPIGKEYISQTEANLTPSLQMSYQVFKEFIDRVGLNGSLFMNNMSEALMESSENDWAIDIQDSGKITSHAKNWFLANGFVDYSNLDLEELIKELRSGNYSSFVASLNDSNLLERMTERYKIHQKERPFKFDVNTIDGRASQLKSLFNNNFSEIDYAAFQNAPIEQQRAVQTKLAEYNSENEALSSPEFSSLLNGTVAMGYRAQQTERQSDFNKNIENKLISKFRTQGYFNENTSPEFYKHVTSNVIPDFALKAQLAGISTDIALERFFQESISGVDEFGDPSQYQIPNYYFDENAYQSRNNLLDEAKKAAVDRPEYEAFIMNELQNADFIKKWKKATSPQLKEDPEENLIMHQDILKSYQDAVNMAQQKFDQVSKTGEGVDIALEELETAKSKLVTEQQKFAIATGGAQYRVVETQPGSGEYKTTGEITRIMSLPEAQQQLQYELETGNEYAQMIAKEELEKAKVRAQYFNKFGEFKSEEDKKDFEKMVTVTKQDSREFLRSELPGFEKRYEQSSFFQQEQERLKQEELTKQQRAESLRKKQLRETPSGMAVFTRRRK